MNGINARNKHEAFASKHQTDLARRGKTMGDHDAIIIGTGQSGPSLARRLVAAGQKVAVIERKFFGGTCVNTGCTPTKTLVASACAAYLARRAGDYGVTIGGPVGVDMKAVKARKDAIAGASRRGVERSLKTLTGCTVYEGHAQFVGTKKVAVDGVVLHADHTFINAGGRGADSTDPRLGSGSLPHQQLNDGCRFPSPTSHCPGRQLHRPRIRAGLSPLRKRGDGDRTSTAADRTRGRRRLKRYDRVAQGGRHRCAS